MTMRAGEYQIRQNGVILREAPRRTLRVPRLPVRRPKNLLDGRPTLSVTTLPREKPRSTGCTVTEPDSSVGAHAPARVKDRVGASLRMTAIPSCGVFPDSV